MIKKATGVLGVVLLAAMAAPCAAGDCGAAQSLLSQGYSVVETARRIGMRSADVAACRRQQTGSSVRLPAARARRFGAAGAPPVGAAGPPPISAAGEPPVGAAGPPPGGPAR